MDDQVRKYRPRESSIRSLGRKPTNRFSEYRHVTRSGRRSMPRLFVCCVLLCLGTLTSAQNTASALAQTPSTPVQVVYLTEGTTIVTYNVDPQTLSPCSCIWPLGVLPKTTRLLRQRLDLSRPRIQECILRILAPIATRDCSPWISPAPLALTCTLRYCTISGLGQEACSLQVKSTPLHSLPKDELGSLVGAELR